jgi:glycerol-3-phosphate dehydrogenase
MVGDFSFRIKPRVGEYILLHKDEGYKCSATLFPCPHPKLGKGVLVQGTLWGNLILGPTARDVLRRNPRTGELEADPEVRDEPADSIMAYILARCAKLVPSFDPGRVIHTFSGARAKTGGRRGKPHDFIVEALRSAPGFVHCAGIDSPGIACSPAIAEEVRRLLHNLGLEQDLDPDFNPRRAPIIVPKDGFRGLKMSKFGSDKQKKNQSQPARNVVCKCERVTEAEVIEAVRRSLPVDSTQAVRKRTRAGMGECQGDPKNYGCEERVARIVARELGVPLEEVGRRPWPASSLLASRFGASPASPTRSAAERLRGLAEAGEARFGKRWWGGKA